MRARATKVGGETSKAFGKFTFAEVNVKNDIVDTVSRDRTVVNTHPEFIDTLDGYAEDLARFDVECPGRLGATVGDKSDIRARFLDSVGGYWEAKGENFGVSENDTTRLRQLDLSTKIRIKALCNAKIAYARAQQFAATGMPHDTYTDQIYDKLNEELLNDVLPAVPIRILSWVGPCRRRACELFIEDIEDACK